MQVSKLVRSVVVTAGLVGAAWSAVSSAATAAVPDDQPVDSNRLVSLNADGTTTGSLQSAYTGISGDGRYVAFMSERPRLVVGEHHSGQQIYLRDQTHGLTTLVSRSPTGKQGRAPSTEPSVSADGTRIAFVSKAANLVPGVGHGPIQVYVYDTTTQTTVLVSHDADGIKGEDKSSEARISADGTHVAFTSEADNLAPRDRNSSPDVFVWDAATDSVTLVSARANGASPSGVSSSPAISADGGLVAFGSRAEDVVRGDKNRHSDVFLRDVQASTTTMVSETSDPSGNGGKGDSYYPTLSGDGSVIAFSTEAFNLVPGASRWAAQQIVRLDRSIGVFQLVSHDGDGAEADNTCQHPTIAADGTRIAYESFASNLVPGDNPLMGDVYLWGSSADATRLVTLTPEGGPADGYSSYPTISGDGAYVAYSSDADNLDPRDDDGYDVFSYRAS